MLLNSVNTNVAAQVALQSLNKTNTELQATQKRISTGYRVADATDDGAAFAVAQRVRADVGALTTVNSQLGNAKGLVATAMSGLTSISTTLNSAKSCSSDRRCEHLADPARPVRRRRTRRLVQQVADTVDGSTYNGQTLLGSASGGVAATTKTVINNESGATSALSAEDVSGLACHPRRPDRRHVQPQRHRLGHLDRRGGRFRSDSGGSRPERHVGHDVVRGRADRSSEPAESGWHGLQLPGQHDLLQQLQDRQPQRRVGRAGRRGFERGVGKPPGAADPATVGHAGIVDGEPSAAVTAQPVQVTRTAGGG